MSLLALQAVSLVIFAAPDSVLGSVVLLDNGLSTVENQFKRRRMDLQFAGREDWQDTENNYKVLGARSG